MKEKHEVLIKRSEALTERKKLEAEGFRSDVQELRRCLVELEKKLNYCLCKNFEKKMLQNIDETGFFRNTIRACTSDNNKQQRLRARSKSSSGYRSSSCSKISKDLTPRRKKTSKPPSSSSCKTAVDLKTASSDSKNKKKAKEQFSVNITEPNFSTSSASNFLKKTQFKDIVEKQSSKAKAEKEDQVVDVLDHPEEVEDTIEAGDNKLKYELQRIFDQFDGKPVDIEVKVKSNNNDESDESCSIEVKNAREKLAEVTRKLANLQNKLNRSFAEAERSSTS